MPPRLTDKVSREEPCKSSLTSWSGPIGELSQAQLSLTGFSFLSLRVPTIAIGRSPISILAYLFEVD